MARRLLFVLKAKSCGGGEIGEEVVGGCVGREALEAAGFVGADAVDGVEDGAHVFLGDAGAELGDAADHAGMHLAEHVGAGGGIAFLFFAKEEAAAMELVFAVVFLELAEGLAGFQVAGLEEIGGMAEAVGLVELVEEGGYDLALLGDGLAFVEIEGGDVDGSGGWSAGGSGFAGGGRRGRR